MAPAQKLGRNLLCPGARWGKKGEKRGKKGGKKKEAGVLCLFCLVSAILDILGRMTTLLSICAALVVLLSPPVETPRFDNVFGGL